MTCQPFYDSFHKYAYMNTNLILEKEHSTLIQMIILHTFSIIIMYYPNLLLFQLLNDSEDTQFLMVFLNSDNYQLYQVYSEHLVEVQLIHLPVVLNESHNVEILTHWRMNQVYSQGLLNQVAAFNVRIRVEALQFMVYLDSFKFNSTKNSLTFIATNVIFVIITIQFIITTIVIFKVDELLFVVEVKIVNEYHVESKYSSIQFIIMVILLLLIIEVVEYFIQFIN